MTVRAAALGAAVACLTARPAAACDPVRFYGTYSVGRRAGTGRVSLAARVREVQALGGNMIVATGDGEKVLDVLPRGMRAVPGCNLMRRKDWMRDGAWSEPAARARLAVLARRFANDPRVYGVCLTHEVTEYADQERRRWMYRLAKEYFPRKKVLHYYGRLWHRGGAGEQIHAYGLGGAVETDVVFVSVQAVRDGRFDPGRAAKLAQVLAEAARTPGIPVWVQTSINADHRGVTGPESMTAVWGREGENMPRWTRLLFRTVHTARGGRPLRVEGFFWRSLGRFPYDLGWPGFGAHRRRAAAIGRARCR